MSRKNFFILLLFILVLASLLRAYGLSRGDMLNDEVLYAFRAIGMLDYFHNPNQTTPIEWFDPSPPWWTHVSFHDHPPLVMVVQHIFMSAFGENAVAFRIASVLFGLLSVWLVYLLGARLFSREAGFVAALLLAVTVNHVFISRVGMQEAYEIFFMLAASFFFLRSLDKEKYFMYAGIALGLAFLTKYTAIILAPIFFIYLLFVKPDALRRRVFWIGAALAILLFSPVVIYNVGLYRATGHFDFQFSYIFHQYPAVWKIAPGKQIGSLSERIRAYIPNLIAANSWLFLSLFAFTAAAFFWKLFRFPKEALRRYGFLAFTIFVIAFLMLAVGPETRFLSLLTPFMALAAGAFLWGIYTRIFAGRSFAWAGIAIFAACIAFEIFYSWNNQIAYYPKGPEPWLASRIRYEDYNLGYRELGAYLDKELAGKMPGAVFDAKYAFLTSLQDAALAKDRREGLTPYRAMIVYYDNFDLGPRLWALDRLLVYHAWPVMSFDDYTSVLSQNGVDTFKRAGVATTYFIARTNIVPSPEFAAAVKGIAPIIIRNPRGDEAFRVYKIQ